MLSMGEGVTSYSSATSQVPKEAAGMGASAPAPATQNSAVVAGAGTSAVVDAPATSSPSMDAATDDLIDLLISADGNYVQELLLEEAAKLADAALRDSIAQVGSSAPVNALADVLRAPKQLAESTVGRLPLPGPLKAAVDFALLPATVLDDLSRLVPTLARPGKTDQETLETFGALWEQLNPTADEAAKSAEASSSAGAAGNGLLPSFPPALELPPALASVQSNAGPLFEQLTDPESRLRQRLPLLGTLSRRFGAALIRRVASRIEEDSQRADAPGLAREVASRAAEPSRSLAAFIEPDASESKQVDTKELIDSKR